jgi:hypothetical protein
MQSAGGGDVRVTRVQVFDVLIHEFREICRRYRAFIFSLLHGYWMGKRREAKSKKQKIEYARLTFEPENL